MDTNYKTQLINLITTPENTPTLLKAIQLWDASAEIQSSVIPNGPLKGLTVTNVFSDEDSSYPLGDDEEMEEIYSELMPSLADTEFLATQMTIMWGNGEMNGWSVHFNRTGEVRTNALDNMDTGKDVLLHHVRDHCQECVDSLKTAQEGGEDMVSSAEVGVYNEIINMIDKG